MECLAIWQNRRVRTDFGYPCTFGWAVFHTTSAAMKSTRRGRIDSRMRDPLLVAKAKASLALDACWADLDGESESVRLAHEPELLGDLRSLFSGVAGDGVV